jgi:hypothetical protein
MMMMMMLSVMMMMFGVMVLFIRMLFSADWMIPDDL